MKLFKFHIDFFLYVARGMVVTKLDPCRSSK